MGPGGSVDLLARAYAELLEKRWGQTVTVINQAGGNGIPGVVRVMQANPDGYTILMDSSSSSSGYAETLGLPFAITDRTLIGRIAQISLYVAVATDSAFETLDDVAERIKRDPSTFTFTSVGAIDTVARRFVQAVGVDPETTRPVPVKSGSDAVAQVAGGHIEFGAGSGASMQPMVDAGRLKILAVTSPKRSSLTPDIPSTAELGYPEVRFVQWYGFSAPPGAPQAVVEIWQEAISEISEDPEFTAKLAKIGLESLPGTAAELAAAIDEEIEALKAD